MSNCAVRFDKRYGRISRQARHQRNEYLRIKDAIISVSIQPWCLLDKPGPSFNMRFEKYMEATFYFPPNLRIRESDFLLTPGIEFHIWRND